MQPETLLARLDALDEILRFAFEQIRKLRADIRESDPELRSHLTPLVRPEPVRVPLQRTPPESEMRPAPDPTWIPILHSVTRGDKSFPPPCHLPAHYLLSPPYENQKARLEVMRILDRVNNVWRAPMPEDTPRCSSCQALVDPFSNADVDYLSHMQPAASLLRGRKRSREESPSPPPGPGGHVAPHLPGAPPSIFPGHTPEATAESLDVLVKLSRELGLPTPEIPG